ncbi:MAG: DUF368 domain-containing protein [bacterium]
MSRLVLFLKGIAMGTADVIPGVSGGTLALILGIYGELVDTIKGLRPHLLLHVLNWVKGGRTAEGWAAVKQEWHHLNLNFLLVLVSGIAAAIVLGSAIIPMLMENYPVAMRASFFGLIVASVVVPFRMISFEKTSTISLVAICMTLGVVFGFVVTNPGNSFDMATEWTTVESRGESLKDVTRRGPSGLSNEQVFGGPKRTVTAGFAEADPTKFAELEALHRKNKIQWSTRMHSKHAANRTKTWSSRRARRFKCLDRRCGLYSSRGSSPSAP